ncbi:MAG: DUF4301 family protein [Muribaculaceae bacterium]
MELNNNDLEFIKEKGIGLATIEEQLERFKTGFPYLKIRSVATIGDGIVRLTDEEIAECIDLWNDFQVSGGTVEKFVPASGAASRMFKNIFGFVSANKPAPETDFEKKFFAEIKDFAFYPALNSACVAAHGKDIDALLAEGEYVKVASALINSEGLNYGALPKALLQFHKTATGAHTPLEEHLEEGAQYASDLNKNVNIHFTVSPEHRKEFEKTIAQKVPAMEQEWGVKYNVSMSEQKASTDTIAVNMDNTPYRENGKLLFRPAGHGALIENLNDIDADVVFVKNIDNVVPRNLRDITVTYKKVIGGYLVKIQRQIAEYLKKLKSGSYTIDELREMVKYTHDVLSIRYDETKNLDDSELALYLINKFNRPIRICGVVKNDGEPGGGPYLAYNEDGSSSPQILEAAQIDSSKPEAVELMKSGTHFNPVDLVCYIKDIDGNKFDLKKYVDKNTGLISEKSKSGVTIKALELPGLWNGSMSDWTSVFVEVPIETFNPVKVVNDLLRPQHQG